MKVPFEPAKEEWHPSVLPGQIVLVSTLDEGGRPNIAPKSWVSMVAFEGPMLGFGCNVRHATYLNAAAWGEFVVNVVPAWLAERAWSLVHSHGAERVRRSGLTLVPAQKVSPPLVAECRAHLECELDDVKQYGDEVFVFGRVLAASIDEDCLAGPLDEQYARLRPIFYLEERTYASIDVPRRIARKEQS